jgi:hypothetical protein
LSENPEYACNIIAQENTKTFVVFAIILGPYPLAAIPQMAYETAVIPWAVKPHFTNRQGLLGTVKSDRLAGEKYQCE